jgi:hypothetical protein
MDLLPCTESVDASTRANVENLHHENFLQSPRDRDQQAPTALMACARLQTDSQRPVIYSSASPCPREYQIPRYTDIGPFQIM